MARLVDFVFVLAPTFWLRLCLGFLALLAEAGRDWGVGLSLDSLPVTLLSDMEQCLCLLTWGSSVEALLMIQNDL
jgi:hypothetical protein